jgi:hypothetical protein
MRNDRKLEVFRLPTPVRYPSQNRVNLGNYPVLYGCVTTGDDWVFIRLMDNESVIDTRKYYLVEIGELLALFIKLIDEFRDVPD